MIKNRIAKIGAFAVAATFAFSLSVNTAGAVTVAELQAQINALMAQLASLQGAPAASVTFTSDLTVGSTGSQVVALQQMLVAKGHLVMPAGVAYGYFGALTKAAVMKWQAANGVPATGYFGPMSRAKANASGGATGTVPGTTVGGGTTTGGTINTPGVEGILTATLAPTPGAGTSVEEGDSKVKVLGIEIEADLSDIRIERIKIKLDQTTTATNDRDFYRDIAERLYVMEGSTVLASVDLNSDTVIEETSGNFYVTVTGLNYIVRKDTEKTLSIAIDAQDSWDSDFDDDTWTVTIPAEGIRGVDGAGLNLYAPASGTTLARTFNTDPSEADTATLAISLNSGTPEDKEVIATEGSDEDEIDGVEVFKFDVEADGDDVTITDVVIDLVRGGVTSTATATTAYLYDGSTLVGSASVAGSDATTMTATFDDIEVVVENDDTKTLTVKLDITDAGYAATTFVASIDAADITSENSEGDNVTESGSADGETITVRKAGLEITLLSKSISKTSAEFSGATSSLKADFKVRLTARGSAVEFGDTASTTYALADQDSTLTAAPSFIIYRGGSATAPEVSSSTTMVIGSGVSAAGGANSWVLGENNSVDIDLSYVMLGKTSAGADVTFGAYAVGLERINWLTLSGGRQTSTFMSGDSDWRTSTVVLP